MSHQSRWASLKTTKDESRSQDGRTPSSSHTIKQQLGSQQSRWSNTGPTHRTSGSPTPSWRSSTPPIGLTARDVTKPLGGKSLDRMALLASPSRGLDALCSLSADLQAQGSMDLTNPEVQEEFRAYISSQIHSRVVPALTAPASSDISTLDSATYLPTPRSSKAALPSTSRAEQELHQLVLLARKLREAVVASKRRDAFVVEVYRLSVQLALLCMDVPQLSASLPRLVFDLLPSGMSRPSDVANADISAILQHLQTPMKLERDLDGPMHTASLLLLQTLCLSGKATRLGQYANGTSSPSTNALPSTSVCLREYRLLRAQLATLYPDAHKQLKLCDQVYAVVRDSNPFLLAHLLEQAELSLWQRILLMQLIPSIRTRAWSIARKTYMYLPISVDLAHVLHPQLTLGSESTTDSALIANLLLLSSSYLAPKELPASAGGEGKTLASTASTPPPDDWEDDDPVNSITDQLAQTTLQRSDVCIPLVESRICDFLHLEYDSSSGVVSRVMQIREGFAFKIR